MNILYVSNLISEIISKFLENLSWNWYLRETVYVVSLSIKMLLVMIFIMMCVAYSTWLEKKLYRVVTLEDHSKSSYLFGLLQPIYYTFKVFLKEMIIPLKVSTFMGFLGPITVLSLAMLGLVVIPLEDKVVFANLNIGILYIVAIFSLSVYGIMVAGWANKSKFYLYGAIRATAYMLSYDLSLTMMIICVILLTGTYNISEIVYYQEEIWNIFKLFPVAILFFIIMIAKTNRDLFNLPKSKREVNQSTINNFGFTFSLFILAEYTNLIIMSSLFTVLFLGGWYPILNITVFLQIPSFLWFIFKVFILVVFIIKLKHMIPQDRYQQLEKVGFKIVIPLSLTILLITAIIIRLMS